MSTSVRVVGLSCSVVTTPRLLVMVPALNEEESIGTVVTKARSVPDADVLVVDDGSSDATAEVANLRRAEEIALMRPERLAENNPEDSVSGRLDR